MNDLFLLQSSVVGTFPMDSDKRPAKGLHAWTVAQGDQVKQVNSYKQVKTVASAKALNDIHAQLQNKNKGGASSSLAVHQALDTSDHSLASLDRA